MTTNLILFSIFVFLAIIVVYLNNRSVMPARIYTFLALGDSYTIGEGLSLDESFPYQLVQLLRKSGMAFTAPEVIAQTGWTTDDLKKGIRKHVFLPSYDFVTLLIGVNNQYRGLDINEYTTQFEQLLKQAIAFAGGESRNVFVLSIPDWSQSPFAAGRDRVKIKAEISKFNVTNKKMAEEYRVQYVNVTDEQPGNGDGSLFTDDQLHFTAREYGRWSQLVAEEIQRLMIYDPQQS